MPIRIKTEPYRKSKKGKQAGLNPTEKQQVKRLVLKGSESKLKEYDWDTIPSLSSVGYGSSSTVIGLYGAIASGTTDNTRVGDRITATLVNIKLAFLPADTSNQLRFIMCTARKGIRYQPSDVANFVQNVLSGRPSGSDQWLSPVDTSRYKVYYDKVLNLRKVPFDGASASSVSETHYVKIRKSINKKFTWDEEQQITNDVYLIVLSDSSVVAHPGCIAGYMLAYYKDL